MGFNIIVAMCKNNGIGFKGNIPWNIKADLNYFSTLTKGNGKNALIMGANTWNSLPQGEMGLKGRDNFVLSKSKQCFDKYVNQERVIKTFTSIDDVERFINNQPTNYDDIWVIGGAQIYKKFLDEKKINKCYITYIDKEFECDTFFPTLDMSQWTELERRSEYDSKYDCKVDYFIYELFHL